MLFEGISQSTKNRRPEDTTDYWSFIFFSCSLISVLKQTDVLKFLALYCVVVCISLHLLICLLSDCDARVCHRRPWRWGWCVLRSFSKKILNLCFRKFILKLISISRLRSRVWVYLCGSVKFVYSVHKKKKKHLIFSFSADVLSAKLLDLLNIFWQEQLFQEKSA